MCIRDREETFCSNTYNPLPVVLKKGRGVYVWDVHCKKYFDFYPHTLQSTKVIVIKKYSGLSQDKLEN